MFYRMIEKARDQWLASRECQISNLIEYMMKQGELRDVQIDAIKTYLYLKIACDNKPLYELFYLGKFNTLLLDELELSSKVRVYLEDNPAAAALFEYSCLKNDEGEQISSKLEQQIRKDPNSIDYRKFFYDTFYGLSYTDYLFSLISIIWACFGVVLVESRAIVLGYEKIIRSVFWLILSIAYIVYIFFIIKNNCSLKSFSFVGVMYLLVGIMFFMLKTGLNGCFDTNGSMNNASIEMVYYCIGSKLFPLTHHVFTNIERNIWLKN